MLRKKGNVGPSAPLGLEKTDCGFRLLVRLAPYGVVGIYGAVANGKSQGFFLSDILPECWAIC